MSLALTERDFDCLQAVKEITVAGWAARVKDVAVNMWVKPPTAIGYLDKLVKASMIEKGSSGYRLTPSGARLVEELTRTHRLFETLLYRAGVPLEEAHRISVAVEKHVDAEGAAALCLQLNHPKVCPHDRPIPAGDKYD